MVLPAIVPHLIAAHAMVIHERARLVQAPANLVITGFGEDPGRLDPKTGKPGLHLPPKIIHVGVGDMHRIADAVNEIASLPHYNVYMPLAVFRPDLPEGAKGGETDVIGCFGIVADFDDADAPRWAERLPIPPQYVLETSAGRFQAFYLFSKPEPLGAVKPVAQRLKEFAKCDHGTSDISHVWRIAGTLNWPNAKKVFDDGRSPEPQQVKVEQRPDGSTISLEKLSKALPEGAAAAGGKAKARAKSGARRRGQPHPAAVMGTEEWCSAALAASNLPEDLQEEMLRPAEGDRSKALFKVITRLIELGLDDQTIENIIHFFPREIGAKYADRDDLDREILRIRAKAGPKDEVALMVEEMNETYSVVDDNGKTVVIYRKKDDELNRNFVVRASFQDFRNLFLNEHLVVSDRAGKPSLKTKGNVWLSHPDRRTYKAGVRFLPGAFEFPDEVYNLWAGWGVEPCAGDWSLMQGHIRDVICSGDLELFQYLTDWMAKAVQDPGTAGEVAVVLRGKRGTGKGVFARALGNLFGQHFLHLSHARHLTGNFNAHLRDACLVFADEAFYAGDKQSEGQLKRLVTEPTLMIEGKYQNAVQVRNCLHVIVSSNDDWVVPAGTDERRFFVLDVAAGRQGDFSYFEAIEKELQSGGAAAMLYDLLHRDLSRFNVRAVPKTAALLDQKTQSFSGAQAWWHNILLDGYCPAEEGVDREGLDQQDWTKSLRVSRDALYADYEDFSKRRKEYKPKDKSHLGAVLRDFVPGVQSERPRGENRRRFYILPPLAACRAEFEKHVGAPIDWEEG
jgi:hypothetical protein